jgi:hypothetical protein
MSAELFPWVSNLPHDLLGVNWAVRSPWPRLFLLTSRNLTLVILSSEWCHAGCSGIGHNNSSPPETSRSRRVLYLCIVSSAPEPRGLTFHRARLEASSSTPPSVEAAERVVADERQRATTMADLLCQAQEAEAASRRRADAAGAATSCRS